MSADRPTPAEPVRTVGRPGGMKRTTVLSAALALVLAACAGAASPSPAPPSGVTPQPEPTGVPGASPTPGVGGGLVLKIVDGGGLVPAHVPLVRLPSVAIYADGRMITPGPMIEIYPGPALPNLQVTQLSSDGLARVIALARRAGLSGPDRTLQAPGIADAPATIFTAVLDGAVHRTVAVALDSEASLDIPADDRATRAALVELQQQLVDIRSTPGAVIGEDGPYQWTALRIVSRHDLVPSEVDGIGPGVVGWPLKPGLAEFGEPVGGDVRCGVLTGDDLATMRPAFQQANELTRWMSAGVEYSLILRPLLPDELGCEPAF